MSTGLILTMGFAPAPLIFSIKTTGASFVVFIGTDSSLKESVDQTVMESRLRPSQYHKLEVLDSPNEIGSICEKFQEAITWLEKQGVTSILSDPTGGRKWMSAGAVMAASFLGLRMLYVDAKTQEGKVVLETMNIVELGNAYDQTGYVSGTKGIEAFNASDFGGAAYHFNTIKPTHAHKKDLFEGLEKLSNCLARWDRFEHYGATISEELDIAIEQIDRALRSGAGSRQFALFSDEMKVFSSLLKKIEATQTLSIEFIVDLFLNAKRCINRRRYDDAIARQYRTLEAISQYSLKEHDIDADNPQYSTLTESQLAIFQAPFPKGSLSDKIDLKKGFWLLKSLEHPVSKYAFVGKQTYKDFRFEGILNERNSSILAHGFKPIGSERVQKFDASLEDLLAGVFGDESKRIKEVFLLPLMPEIGF